MRADRLVATLLLMQSRGRITAGELAAVLEISVATARRDLEALSAAGVPVYPQAGRGGGWSLVGGARTDLSGLTSAETQALFLLAGPAAAVTPQIRSGLRKLVRALPQTFRADAEAAADAVTIDAARWGENEPQRTDLVEMLQAAVVRRRKIDLGYGGRGGQTQRLVDPWGLVAKAGVWYLVAGTERGQRTFRVDRIVDVVVTDLIADRPADFALSGAWQRVVDEVEARRSLVEATVLVDARYLHALRGQFGRHCHVVDESRDDGRVRVRLAAPTPLMIAQWLAGWGALIEDVDSEPVRAELARLGAELTARYPASPTRLPRPAVSPPGSLPAPSHGPAGRDSAGTSPPA